METDIEKFSSDVNQELLELEKLGVEVSKKTLTKSLDIAEMKEYDNMRVSDAADLLLDLYN